MHDSTTSFMWYMVLGGVVIFLLCWLTTLTTNYREGYGGQVKNIKKIPFNDCVRICKSYRDGCLRQFADTDAMECIKGMDHCAAECYYSSAHRL